MARKHDLYGGSGSIVEQARIDQLLDGMQDLRPKIMPLVYRDAFQARACGCAAGAVGWLVDVGL